MEISEIQAATCKGLFQNQQTSFLSLQTANL